MPVFESNRIEFKRELNDKLERSIVAFLNTNEGRVLYISIDGSGESIRLFDIDLYFNGKLLTALKIIFRRQRLVCLISR